MRGFQLKVKCFPLRLLAGEEEESPSREVTMETRTEGAVQMRLSWTEGVGMVVCTCLFATELRVRAASLPIGPKLPSVPFYSLICDSDLRVKSCPGQSSVTSYP